ncbi:Carbohydrate-responsive element-binding protein [Collichthys lucidus]|uniref:Carbohydrate-responsive element-binding protein n=1 Tax=Collichthys lucidus TaxID=240159 RepID=A0A4U5V6R4_COLLU|nr:Carbohydrate-responsive element-binding protein [Collichthys lucidus]
MAQSRGRVCSAAQSQLQNSSDSDSEMEPVRVACGIGPYPGAFPCTQVIHSGHFMVSSPHSDSAPRRRKSGGSLRYDFDTVNRTWCQTYPFSSGTLSIDPTLTRLFDCMSLAYSVSVSRQQAIVLEGSYWKRRIEVVIKEYHKWRIYYKKRLQKKKDDILSMLQEKIDVILKEMQLLYVCHFVFVYVDVNDVLGQICQAKLEKWSNQMYQEPEAAPVEAHMFDLDCLLSDISDTLFTMTQKPSPWASDRHNTYTSNADIIQPGLTPLQPNLDDFMDIPAPQLLIDTQLAQSSVHQAHSYPHTGDTYPQTPCHSLSYPTAVSDPVHAALPSVTVAHCFSVPEQVAVTGVRGKHKQKTGGVRTAGPPVVQPGPLSTAPTPTSCLAKLLSSGGRERKPSLGFDTTLVTAKGQRSTSPSSSQSSSSTHVGGASSQLQHAAGWPAGIPVVIPLHSQSATLGHSGPHASTSRGSAVSALLSHDSTPTGTTLLIPKTEKLSPVQLYSTDRSSLTVNFSGHPGQTSPPNPLDKASNPESSHSGFSRHGKIESSKHTETRRITHISAEQKRRFNIKLGFDTLHNLVTTLSSQPSIKISKATTLQKTAEYISKMQQERAQLHEEAQRLREEIQLLNSAINACQQQLPATGVPITRQRFDHMRQKFREYVRAQTLQNWKFWIRQFSIIIEPLFESYNGMVSTASVEDLCRSTLSWLDQHCSLPALRPMVLSSLRLLSTTTAILSDPGLLPEQATLAVTQGDVAATLDHSLQSATRDNIHPM